MIAKLTGIVDSVGDSFAVIDVGGVGYLVFCSRTTLSQLAVGEAASLQVETLVRDDAIHLYGFAAAAERHWFRMLMTVQGVGAKAALAILAVASADALVGAIITGDRGAITRAAGVGPKLAGRIIAELKDKVQDGAWAGAALPSMAHHGVPFGLVGDAVSALVHLGFRQSEAMVAVSHAAQRLGEAAGVEALIRDGLGELTPRD